MRQLERIEACSERRKVTEGCAILALIMHQCESRFGRARVGRPVIDHDIA
jgi:hypothetical protein